MWPEVADVVAVHCASILFLIVCDLQSFYFQGKKVIPCTKEEYETLQRGKLNYELLWLQ